VQIKGGNRSRFNITKASRKDIQKLE
jgi:hypothetical protein